MIKKILFIIASLVSILVIIGFLFLLGKVAQKKQNQDKYEFSAPAGYIPISSPPFITKERCQAVKGWVWSDDIGECLSDNLLQGKSSLPWNAVKDADTSDAGSYTCNSQGTLEDRMHAAINQQWDKIVKEGEYTALAIADCIDGQRDLPQSIGGTSGPSRNLWLKENWTRLSGSHLASLEEFSGVCGYERTLADYQINGEWIATVDDPSVECNSDIKYSDANSYKSFVVTKSGCEVCHGRQSASLSNYHGESTVKNWFNNNIGFRVFLRP